MERRRLPNRRRCVASKGTVSGMRRSFFAIVDFDTDGTPLGIDLKAANVGSDYRAVMDAFGVTASLALQYGVPWEALMANWKKRCPEIAGIIENAKECFDADAECGRPTAAEEA